MSSSPPSPRSSQAKLNTMKTQPSSLHALFFLFSPFIYSTSAAVAVTPIGTLKTCVTNALSGSNVAKRIVTKGDDVYPDARTGTIV
jgi:hypothetical protein